ncbi:MFS transporter [Dyadobacter sandarakinus]|uniref:MFS transporter n=1 Tax=Dyadobacter sandarakinus TaxID=2747268 RepID=A0ABX7IE98_9BACT|nr:MFS transporter [Dyadobacter sandarakinus]QRR04048.1 MFS transporter [Dyadobacter sandarakinus]
MRYFTFFYLYIMQGIPSGFALTAVANHLTAKGLSSYSVGSFVAIVGLPWVLQFVWGPVIDRFQFSVIGHRKHWVLLTQVVAFLASLGLLLISDPVRQVSLLSVLFFVHSIFASVQDASVDAIAISIVPVQERGRVNAFMRGGYLLGIAAGSAGLSTILYSYNFFYAAATQSALLLFFTALTFLIKLDRSDQYLPSRDTIRKKRVEKNTDNPDLKWLFTELYKAIFERSSIRIFLQIALVYGCISIFVRAFSYHLIHHLHWNDRSVSVLQGGWGVAATLIVTLSGGYLADKLGAARLQHKVMAVIAIFLLVFSILSQFWVLKAVSITGLLLFNFADPMFSVAAMPVLMLLCRKKIEGSQFTTYMALVNFCDVIGSYFSGWAMTFIDASTIGFACGIVIISVIISKRYFRSRTMESLKGEA